MVIKLVGKGCGDANVDDEVIVVVLDQAVPATVDPRPVKPLAAETLEVGIAASIGPICARCIR